MTTPPTLIGLTGGIASGKSTVAGFLRELGVPVIDADKLGHLVLYKEGGEAYGPVVELFGEDILDAAGEINRAALGERVFGDKEALARLESITHPAIGRLSQKGIEMIAARGEPLAVYEAALLVETGMHRALDTLVVVSCKVSTQLDRVVARDGLSRDAAALRIASQFPPEEKLRVASHVIDSDVPLDEMRAATIKVWGEIRDKYGALS